MLRDYGVPAHELVIETNYELEGDWYEVNRIEFKPIARLGRAAGVQLHDLARVAIDRCARSFGLASDRVTLHSALL
jgi:hypothetical protein